LANDCRHFCCDIRRNIGGSEMNGVLIYACAMVTAVFIAACSQILLKKAATKEYKNLLSEYLNLRVISAYMLFGISAATSMYALRHISLTLAVILESTGYVFVAGLSWVFLREKLSLRRIFGILLILIGIIIFNLR